jgi:hypothetical protein
MSFPFRTLAQACTTLRIRAHSTCAGIVFILAFVAGCSPSSTGGTTTPQVVAPSIATQPLAQSVGVGETATFSVSASGTAPLTYQWLRGGSAVASAKGASYTTPALALSDDGSLFSVTVSNSAGSVTSSGAKVSVSTKAPMIVTDPTSTSKVDGDSANFSVVVSGTGPFSYQWLRGSTAIPGATASSYTLPAVSLADTGSTFSVQVSNTAGSATSSPATLTVTAKPVSITVQPGGVTRFAGETASFSVSAVGSAPTYQWRKNAAAIAGATGASYTTPVLAATDDNAVYDVLVSNAAGTATSSEATLRVGPFATPYTTQKGVKLNLYAWPGKNYAFLSKTAALSPVLMRQILAGADGTWSYYAGAVGKTPGIYLNYNALGTIANTGVGGVDLCGDGCTYIGATGMEISDRITNLLYTNVPNQYDWVVFYETGRSFWLFSDQIAYKTPADSGCEVTGFAVFMGIRSLLALGLPSDYGTSIPNNPDPFANELAALNQYTNDNTLNFNNTFLTNTFHSTYGDCPVLWTGLVQKLSLTYGGEAFVQSLFKEVLKRPNATTTQDAIDNFVLAASAAAGKNLTYTFGTTWKWPISTSASQEAQAKYGNPL